MKKIFLILIGLVVLSACSKHDPILPGERFDIFDSTDVVVENKVVPDLSETQKNIYGTSCDYNQDASNNIYKGGKKIYSGFAPNSVVKSNQSPICGANAIYTGLSTGEVIKINSDTNRLVWVADVFRANNLTGGASMVDIVAHVGIDNGFVYAGGLGDAFCKLKDKDGEKIWCINISVPVDFIIVDEFAFVVGADNNLYAIDTKQGKVYWKSEIKKQVKPEYNGEFIKIGKEKINYKNGEKIK